MIFHEALKPLMVSVDEVDYYPENPRRGDTRALRESLTTNGMYQPIVAQASTKYVIAGNHRLEALLELGEKQVPVLFVDVDDAEARRIALADNRTSDLAFYDDRALFDLLDKLMADEGGDISALEGTGYDRAAFEMLMQGLEPSGSVLGGVRQGVMPDERLDEYNQLDLRSIILPYSIEEYDRVATAFQALRATWQLDTNAEVVSRLVANAMDDLAESGLPEPEAVDAP